jgi:hypothetical protein
MTIGAAWRPKEVPARAGDTTTINRRKGRRQAPGEEDDDGATTAPASKPAKPTKELSGVQAFHAAARTSTRT